MHRLLTVVLFAIFALLSAEPLCAQIYSDVDTVGTVTAEGLAGDTVTVLFDLVNTFPVGGFQVRVIYDTTSFIPMAMRVGSRADSFEVFGANFDEPGAANFYATTMRPLENPIVPGNGPIIEFDIAVRDSAVPGIYYLRFVDADSLSHQNALSNARGDSLIIPIFAERALTVLPLDAADDGRELPEAFALDQNYPNPFNGETRITFHLEKASRVELSVIDLLGRVVATPFSGVAPAGASSITWDGSVSTGENVTSGIYLYRLVDSGGKLVTHKMTLLK